MADRRRRNWWAVPELRLLGLGLPLELLWEIAQYPLYDVWHRHDWGDILYGLAHCTLGDLFILMVAYEIVAAIARNRFWFRTRPIMGGLAFTLLGVAYTANSEINNVWIKGAWGYTDLMPLLPVVGVGGMPLLQWVLIPPVLVWQMKQFDGCH